MIKNLFDLIKAPFSFIVMILKALEASVNEAERLVSEEKKNKQKSEIDKAVQSNIDRHLFKERLFNEEDGLIAKEWKNVRAGLKVIGMDAHDPETPEECELKNIQERLDNRWKEVGDTYEKYIGKRYEDNGYLVVYNGFIRGMSDSGVDLVAISLTNPTRHIIQCKNYAKTLLDIDVADEILKNLKFYLSDYLKLTPAEINYYLDEDLPDTEVIEHVIRSFRYNSKYILFIPHFDVISEPLKERLEMVSTNRYSYGELLIVIAGIS
jgi:hypothetical protein